MVKYRMRRVAHHYGSFDNERWFVDRSKFLFGWDKSVYNAYGVAGKAACAEWIKREMAVPHKYYIDSVQAAINLARVPRAERAVSPGSGKCVCQVNAGPDQTL